MSVYIADNSKHLSLALSSVLNQDIPPNEVVIIEDGPISKSLKTVLDITEQNSLIEIRRYALGCNQGLGPALQFGLKKCRYEWIARMDSDDISLKNRFKKQIDYISHHPSIDVLGSYIDEYDDSMTHKLAVRKAPSEHKKIVDRMKKRNPFNHMTIMYRKSIVEKVGGYEDCLYFEDYLLWCKLKLYSANFYNIKEALVLARAGSAISERRGGLKYAKSIVIFQHKVFAMGFINLRESLFNCLIRVPVALMPKFLRAFVYRFFLRSRVDKA